MLCLTAAEIFHILGRGRKKNAKRKKGKRKNAKRKEVDNLPFSVFCVELQRKEAAVGAAPISKCEQCGFSKSPFPLEINIPTSLPTCTK